ncbi:MAG: carboxylating nicotinate-nucleotide diphosphorylase [Bacillota bacterium]
MDLNLNYLDKILHNALLEDIGSGDITTMATVTADAVTRAVIHVKEEGVVAGLPAAARVFALMDPGVVFTPRKNDGDPVKKSDVLAEIAGPARAILTGERLALNLLQRLSAIATRTRKIATMLSGYNTVVADTRKTTPGLRLLEKYAVRAGGGHNHRFGLFDGILIKDNHIKVAGGVQKAVQLAKQVAPHTIKVEVEVESLAGVKEALAAGADIIMLDNMDLPQIKEAVRLINGRALVEVSGGVTEERILSLAEAGVDIISMGALTHSVKALDISLDVGEIKSGEYINY